MMTGILYPDGRRETRESPQRNPGLWQGKGTTSSITITENKSRYTLIETLYYIYNVRSVVRVGAVSVLYRVTITGNDGVFHVYFCVFLTTKLMRHILFQVNITSYFRIVTNSLESKQVSLHM